MSCAILVLISLWQGLATAAAQQPYPFDLAKRNPTALRALRAVVPARLKRIPWIYDLNGVAGPMVAITIGGKSYLGGMVCKPHDCAANKFAFLVAADGTRAVAALRSTDLTKARVQAFGQAASADEAFLAGQLR